VGGGKSSIAERLKYLMQKVPFYALKGSPVNESPLGLFDAAEDGPVLEEQFGIPRRYLQHVLSPWAVKRLEEFGGDIRQFRVVKRYPSILQAGGIAKTEPGDENNQDISSLVGKVDIRKLENFAQDDTDAYSYSGGLCLANQGLLEFVEMFKAPIKVLHPLLTPRRRATTRAPRALARFRSTAWCWRTATRASGRPFATTATTRPSSTASTSSRCLLPARRGGEDLREADPRVVAGQRRLRARHAQDDGAVRRAHAPEGAENSSIFSKMQVYDGESLKDTDPRAKSYQEYRDYAGVDEGMSGISTRFAFKILSKVFNYDSTEVAANPVHLMYVLEQQIEREQFPPSWRRTPASSRNTCRRATPSSSARRSRPPTWRATASTARTSSTATSPTPTTGSRTASTATPTPARCSTATRSTPSWRRSKARHRQPQGLPQRDRQLRAARAPTTRARTRAGPATRSCAW
jgi:serine protein kinase